MNIEEKPQVTEDSQKFEIREEIFHRDSGITEVIHRNPKTGEITLKLKFLPRPPENWMVDWNSGEEVSTPTNSSEDFQIMEEVD